MDVLSRQDNDKTIQFGKNVLSGDIVYYSILKKIFRIINCYPG